MVEVQGLSIPNFPRGAIIENSVSPDVSRHPGLDPGSILTFYVFIIVRKENGYRIKSGMT